MWRWWWKREKHLHEGVAELPQAVPGLAALQGEVDHADVCHGGAQPQGQQVLQGAIQEEGGHRPQPQGPCAEPNVRSTRGNPPSASESKDREASRGAV